MGLFAQPQAAEADRIAGLIGAKASGVFAGALMHAPVDLTESARERLRLLKA